MCFVGGKYKGNSVIMQGRRVTRYTDSWLDCDTVHDQRNIWVPLLFYAKFEHPGLSMVSMVVPTKLNPTQSILSN